MAVPPPLTLGLALPTPPDETPEPELRLVPALWPDRSPSDEDEQAARAKTAPRRTA
jgi:hypothetical protein